MSEQQYGPTLVSAIGTGRLIEVSREEPCYPLLCSLDRETF